MNKHEIVDFLFIAAVINYLILSIWFGVFLFNHAWMYGLHTRWFKISVETFDAIHYAGMTAYKIGIMLFLLVPMIALLVSR